MFHVAWPANPFERWMTTACRATRSIPGLGRPGGAAFEKVIDRTRARFEPAIATTAVNL